MEDITSRAMDVLMRYAPVWAASMAGRTRVFLSDETSTAYVTGGNNRFKIVINPKLEPDMPFILMHEVAHIFRSDIISMNRNKHMAMRINIAADCIINDSLDKMGVPISQESRDDMCWGKDIYKQSCHAKSINDLMKLHQYEPEGAAGPSEPGNVTKDGEPVDAGGQGEGEPGEGENSHDGVGDDFSGHIGLGDGQVHGDPRSLARSVVGYARRMFFEQGFKSKNMSTKYDWRRNRSSFASVKDVVVPRLTVGEYGHNTEGPLVNLVLDTSGSMKPSWVKTAATIAREIGNAGLDYDLWLTPSTCKAKNPDRVLDLLSSSSQLTEFIHEPSRNNNVGPRPSRAIPIEPIGRGANELREIANMATEDPVVWIYIGDYKSSIDYQLMLDSNFLHIPMLDHEGLAGDQWTSTIFRALDERSLPRWYYKQ